MKKLLQFPYYFLIDLIVQPIRVFSFMSVALFVMAKPMSDIAIENRPPNSSAWEATFNNHGGYIEWFLIKNHVLLFVMALLGLLVTTFVTYKMQTLRTKLVNQGLITLGVKEQIANFVTIAAFGLSGYLFFRFFMAN